MSETIAIRTDGLSKTFGRRKSKHMQAVDHLNSGSLRAMRISPGSMSGRIAAFCSAAGRSLRART